MQNREVCMEFFAIFKNIVSNVLKLGKPATSEMLFHVIDHFFIIY